MMNKQAGARPVSSAEFSKRFIREVLPPLFAGGILLGMAIVGVRGFGEEESGSIARASAPLVLRECAPVIGDQESLLSLEPTSVITAQRLGETTCAFIVQPKP